MHSSHNPPPEPTAEQLAHARAEHRRHVEFYQRLQEVSSHHNPRFSVTNIIIALNIVVFVVMGFLGAGWFMPAEDGMLVYIKYGANNGAATTNGEWWRLLTCMFMHYGIIHIAVNMWALYQAGAFLEKLQGRFIYALIYLASGLSGSFASIIWHGDQTWSAGASGAVFGVFGAILGYMLRMRSGLPATVYKPIMKSTATFAVYNIAFGAAVTGIDNAAHIGGFVGGVVLGAALAQPLNLSLRRIRRLQTLGLAGLLFTALIFGGIKLTPRFNYSVTDELAWGTKEASILNKLNTLGTSRNGVLKKFASDNNTRELANWIDSSLIPTYRELLEETSSPRFNPDQITAKRQKLLITALDESRQTWADFNTRLKDDRAFDLSTCMQRSNQIVANFNQANKALKYETLPRKNKNPATGASDSSS
ncbi:rhomboid family intramembrane serine protease [Ereboglobus luteus]|nr:rhomboid family intramembrane serine protease [Ereboglobus luteus]